MSAPFRLEPLADQDRTTLNCGEEILDRYFQTQVTQDIRRRIANCFVAVDVENGQVAGFYTLSSASIPFSELPETTSKKLPRYPTIPAVRIGRLAVDLRYQGRGLGAALLGDAVTRSVKAGAAAFCLVVDAKHDKAVAFYQHHGFIVCISQPNALFLPIATAAKAFLDPVEASVSLASSK